MHLLVGLGNPGARYAGNRHNIGFLALDSIHRHWRGTPWRSRFQGEASEATIAGEKVVLLKPTTFMNESGRAVRAAMDFYKLEPKDVTVFYDELDLAPFKVKVKIGGGAAGHNGIRSITDHIGADFRRVRLGIGHPGNKDRVTSYVLGNFHKSEIDDLADLLGAVSAEAAWLAKGDDVRFMNDVAMRLQQD